MALRRYALFAVVAFALLTAASGVRLFVRYRGAGIEEAGVVTVVERVGGEVGRFRSSFRHRVRTESGAEYHMTFTELYPVGARLWVKYRRFEHGDVVTVTFYARLPD